MRKILVIVHVEPDFDKTGDMEDILVRAIVRYSRNFDHVINVTSAGALTGTKPFEQLTQFHEEEWIWGYDGNDPACYEDQAQKHIIGEDFIATTGHEYSFIEDWMKTLCKYSKYTLVGGCRTECLQDVYEIFQHLDLKVSVYERLTYG